MTNQQQEQADRLARIRTELDDERIHYNRTGFMNMSPDDIAYLLDEIERLQATQAHLLVEVADLRLTLTAKQQALSLAVADRERLTAEVERLNALLARQAISWQQEIDDALAKARRWKDRVDELESVNWQLVAAEEQEKRHTAESERDALAAQVAAAREALEKIADGEAGNRSGTWDWASVASDYQIEASIALTALDAALEEPGG